LPRRAIPEQASSYRAGSPDSSAIGVPQAQEGSTKSDNAKKTLSSFRVPRLPRGNAIPLRSCVGRGNDKGNLPKFMQRMGHMHTKRWQRANFALATDTPMNHP
jgi:hypothetical protein